MYSVFRLALVLGTMTAYGAAAPQPLRVCADSNNLPYSNDRQEGFENKLAEMIAQDLDRPLQYFWWPHSPRFAEKTFKAGACDVIMEVPSTYDLALPTHPYYSSSYVFVTRKDRHIGLQNLDDPFLRQARIGLHVVGDDGAFIPPAQELAERGIIRNVVGYNIFGNFDKPNPPAQLIQAVARGDIDVAIAWGPLAGYFAKSSEVPLEVQPVCPSKTRSSLPLVFQMSMGVRRGEGELKQQLESEISRRQVEIRSVLQSYGIPLLDSSARSCQ